MRLSGTEVSSCSLLSPEQQILKSLSGENDLGLEESSGIDNTRARNQSAVDHRDSRTSSLSRKSPPRTHERAFKIELPASATGSGRPEYQPKSHREQNPPDANNKTIILRLK
ncbi:hypothetical protein BO99DRAFT_398990 [Aspergillus violaceofuscus CBS 115571]|uniref:Uncharacterized protein n=1 Tax=Aspergillus violaceofuscus (strain CBS 115571) TaxID=1450538 RepID=A0A2V5I4L9_ASPV1|nr:hypothetical protein BO99DRAFT_398990 [Aspergillus violaceofuscus CBS 115571]